MVGIEVDVDLLFMQAPLDVVVIYSCLCSSQQQRGEEDNVHILAYFSCCGPAHPEELEACLSKIREGRYTRAKRMVQKLKALNKPVKWESVLDIAGEGVAPCRPHVARALVEAGHVDTIGEAFTKYLRDSGPAYVAYVLHPVISIYDLFVSFQPFSLLCCSMDLQRCRAAC
jgi:predicted metal-dependent phosphoesterase TrpH